MTREKLCRTRAATAPAGFPARADEARQVQGNQSRGIRQSLGQLTQSPLNFGVDKTWSAAILGKTGLQAGCAGALLSERVGPAASGPSAHAQPWRNVSGEDGPPIPWWNWCV